MTLLQELLDGFYESRGIPVEGRPNGLDPVWLSSVTNQSSVSSLRDDLCTAIFTNTSRLRRDVIRNDESLDRLDYTVLAMYWRETCENESFVHGIFSLAHLVSEEVVELIFAYASLSTLHEGHYMVQVLQDEDGDRLTECSQCPRIVFSHDTPCSCCDGCSSCCNCVHCSDCNEPVEHTCSRCNECDDCCDCAHCSHCGEPVECTCEDCNRCDDCCECHARLDSITGTESREPFDANALSDRRSFSSKRLAGVEWEFNGASKADPIRKWIRKWRAGLHTDSSAGATTGQGGYEAVTAPIAGDHIAACLGDLAEAFADAEAKVNERCGIHVHVDAHDLLWPDIFRLLRVYAHIEPVLFAIAGQNRQSNHYCYRTGPAFESSLRSLDRKAAVIKLALVEGNQGDGARIRDDRAREFVREKLDKKSSGRYRSLNLCPWLARYRSTKKMPNSYKPTGRLAKDATIEFRLHRHSLDGERVIGWTQLCVTIIDWIANASDKEADAIVQMTALRALATIAPRSTPWILKRIREWRRATKIKSMGKARRTVRFREGRWVCAA